MQFRTDSFAVVVVRGAVFWIALSMSALAVERSNLAPNTCDRLAGDPIDAGRPIGVGGVPFAKINVIDAIPACRVALAARPDDPRTAYQLGRALMRRGDRDAVTEAANLYKRAADQGLGPAQINLGILHVATRQPKNQQEALRLFRLAAEQGDAGGQYMLGTGYVAGEAGLPKDDREALRLFKLAADQGLAAAQNEIGNFHANGRGGLPKNEKEAVRQYGLAAAQSLAAAQYNLGFMYANGRGGLASNDREAARLYRLAADQGYANAVRGAKVVGR